MAPRLYDRQMERLDARFDALARPDGRHVNRRGPNSAREEDELCDHEVKKVSRIGPELEARRGLAIIGRKAQAEGHGKSRNADAR